MSDLILLSGGLDSTAATAISARAGRLAAVVSVDYGQRHVREVTAAVAVASHYGVRLDVLDLRSWGGLLTGSALTDSTVAVPHGAYDGENLAVTAVPNRNAVLIMAAAGVAAARGIDRVVTAVHDGDHELYPDCRPAFIQSAARTVELSTDGAVTVAAPFVKYSKAEIVDHGHAAGAPFGLTWSCYRGEATHCGQCGTCQERRTAFITANVVDPTVYAN